MEKAFLVCFFFSGFYLFMVYGYSYFIMIVSIEVAMLAFILFFTINTCYPSGMYYFLFVISLVVCMGSYGLTILMQIHRRAGSDEHFY